ncbi:MAG: HEAT repeat domain-containing protein, partial [Planctomycetota bacterium]|nr:HEAT repeat domain-containing protein [Planctomycetota bacterium]
DAIAPLLKEKDKETVSLRFKKDLVHRAYTNPNPALVPALEPMLLHDDVFVATWAARALGRIGTPSAIQTLVRGLAGEDQERLVEGLAASSSKEATKELARLAEEGSGFGARPKAARALLKRPGAVAADGLVRHVAVAESYNLSSALLVATKYGPTLEPRLVSALEAEKDAARLANLLRLAALIPSVNCVRIAAGHQQSSDPKVRLGAVAVRAQAGEGKSELASAFAGASGGDKIVILEALGHLGADSVLRASIDDRVRQDSPALFLVALKAAGRAKDKSLRTKLTKLLADPNPLVVASAAHGLVLMGEKKRVLALLESRQYTIVSAIARGLGETKDASAVSVLIDAYGADDGAWIGSEPGEGGPYGMPRQEIAAALRRIGGNDAEAFLKRIEG